ncbi:translation elongation factor Ts [Entomomonas asaccharolytica]|uniref:Elongation factor Ts n=1 Tax=Entomomonas asaccharolytica TaxID=2785331 RepID=A0A974NFF9_9GAMM|nr:translation elongation factor Ts [Entomomonas asaccharolytica]QQP85604.1 elongation factor Ts [Entomomonas asaccharolytica]
MAEITAALVKELRERTGLGMMECKKALVAANGDIEKAIDELRKSGAVKSAKAAGRVAADGVVAAKVADDGKYGVMVEVNSETDFVARDDNFKAFVADTLEKAFAGKMTDVSQLAEAQETARQALVQKIGENITIRRIAVAEGDVVGAYVHSNSRIAALVALQGGGDAELAKDIAMHVTASNPAVLNPTDISEELVAKEKEVFLALNKEKIEGKPAEVVEKMVSGRIQKFLSEASLVGQAFVKDDSVKVGDHAKKNGAEIVSFVRFGVGEGIEKAEVDFAAEVAAQVAATKQ